MPKSCEYFQTGACTSCLHLPKTGEFDLITYQRTILVKQTLLSDHFSNPATTKFTNSNLVLLPFVRSENVFGFRSKVKFSFRKTGNVVQLGYYGENQIFHELESCLAHESKLQSCALQIKTAISEHQVSIYDLETRSGELKSLILVLGAEGKIGVKFIFRSPALKSKLKKIAVELVKANSAIEYVVMNIQPEHSSILEGDQELPIHGVSFLKMNYGAFDLMLSSKSFSQVNTSVATALYASAKAIVKGIQAKHVLDLFCGAGGFLFSCASEIQSGIGIEISSLAVKVANNFASESRQLKLKFQNHDLLKMISLDQFTQKWRGDVSALIVNPPRRGLGKQLASSINSSEFQNVIYSSCNLETLLIDLQSMTNFKIKSVQGFDMFPWTDHMEILVHLQR